MIFDVHCFSATEDEDFSILLEALEGTCKAINFKSILKQRPLYKLV